MQVVSNVFGNGSARTGGGVIQGTASEAVLVALIAARDRMMKKTGKDSLAKFVVYSADQTHASVKKACQVIWQLASISFRTA